MAVQNIKRSLIVCAAVGLSSLSGIAMAAPSCPPNYDEVDLEPGRGCICDDSGFLCKLGPSDEEFPSCQGAPACDAQGGGGGGDEGPGEDPDDGDDVDDGDEIPDYDSEDLLLSLEDLTYNMLDICACEDDGNALSGKACRQVLQSLSKLTSKLKKGLDKDNLVDDSGMSNLGDLIEEVNVGKRSCKGAQ